jgi:hypothetical protein
MNRYWSWAALAVVILAVGVGCIRAADKADITGKYSCEGTNNQNKTYKGTVEITKVGDAYQLAWTLTSGESYEGVGILSATQIPRSRGVS